MQFCTVRTAADIPTTDCRLDALKVGDMVLVSGRVLSVTQIDHTPDPDGGSDIYCVYFGSECTLGRAGAIAAVYPPILGMEIPGNRPDLISRCTLGNIDPQHGGSEHTGRCAALEVAHQIGVEAFTPDGHTGLERLMSATTLVTPRFDLDAAAGMALVQLAQQGEFRCQDPAYSGFHRVDWTPGLMDRLRLIDQADSFAFGEWPGPRPLPTAEELWAEQGGVGELEALAAVNWVTGWAAQGRLTLKEAVAVVGDWLVYGEDASLKDEPLNFDHCRDLLARGSDQLSSGAAGLLELARQEATATRLDVVQALQGGRLKLELHDTWNAHGRTWPDGSTARVSCAYTELDGSLPSSSTAGLAYCLAPVSVVHLPDGRFSVAWWGEGRVDKAKLASTLTALELEAGIAHELSETGLSAVSPESLDAMKPHCSWGGPATMCSSPMNRRSFLTKDQVLNAVFEAIR